MSENPPCLSGTREIDTDADTHTQKYVMPIYIVALSLVVVGFSFLVGRTGCGGWQ
jgi:hypothetical protein